MLKLLPERQKWLTLLIEFFIWHLFIAKNETQLQFYLTILYFLRALEPAAEVLVDEAAEASAEVETAEFEFNTSSMKPLNGNTVTVLPHSFIFPPSLLRLRLLRPGQRLKLLSSRSTLPH